MRTNRAGANEWRPPFSFLPMKNYCCCLAFGSSGQRSSSHGVDLPPCSFLSLLLFFPFVFPLLCWSRPCRCPRSTILSPRTTRCSIPIRIILLLVPMLAMSMLMLLALVVVAAPRGEASWNHCASPRRSPLSSHTRLSRVHVTCFASCVRVSREFKAASSSIGEYIEHTMERAGGNECRRSKYVHARSHVQRRAFDCRARIGRTHLS